MRKSTNLDGNDRNTVVAARAAPRAATAHKPRMDKTISDRQEGLESAGIALRAAHLRAARERDSDAHKVYRALTAQNGSLVATVAQSIHGHLRSVPLHERCAKVMADDCAMLSDIGSSQKVADINGETPSDDLAYALAALGFSLDVTGASMRTVYEMMNCIPGSSILRMYPGPAVDAAKNVVLAVSTDSVNGNACPPSPSESNLIKALGKPGGYLPVHSTTLPPGTVMGWCNLTRNSTGDMSGTQYFKCDVKNGIYTYSPKDHKRFGTISEVKHYNYPFQREAIEWMVTCAIATTKLQCLEAKLSAMSHHEVSSMKQARSIGSGAVNTSMLENCSDDDDGDMCCEAEPIRKPTTARPETRNEYIERKLREKEGPVELDWFKHQAHGTSPSTSAEDDTEWEMSYGNPHARLHQVPGLVRVDGDSTSRDWNSNFRKDASWEAYLSQPMQQRAGSRAISAFPTPGMTRAARRDLFKELTGNRK